MSPAIKPAPVRKSVFLEAPADIAFQVFTTGFNRWWPRSHSIGKAPLEKAVLEPKLGGRWYGIDVKGEEAEWGEVLVWSPPSRIVLAWRISASWAYDPNLLTEVEVTFTPEGKGVRVDLEHRLLENMGPAADKARQSVDGPGGWGAILKSFAKEAGKGR